MKIYFYLSFLVVWLVSCGNDSKLAGNLLNEALMCYESRELATAKLYIDSLKISYPKEIKIQREALQLMRKIELDEQIRNLNYCDSMLIVCRVRADSLKKNFIFEKDAIYDEVGKYLSKQQKFENNVRKSYIRCRVNERGEMYIASVYYGTNPLNHNQLKVSKQDGQYTETDKVPRDGGLNYSFKDLGATTEIVTYMKRKTEDVIQFICNNHNENLKAEYLGGNRAYAIPMAVSDKNAVVEINKLAVVLGDVERLKKEIQKAQKRIEYLKQKNIFVNF